MPVHRGVNEAGASFLYAELEELEEWLKRWAPIASPAMEPRRGRVIALALAVTAFLVSAYALRTRAVVPSAPSAVTIGRIFGQATAEHTNGHSVLKFTVDANITLGLDGVVWVASQDLVHAVDGDRMKVQRSIRIDPGVSSMQLSADGRTLWLGHSDGSITGLDTLSGTSKRFSLGSRLKEIILTPDGGKLFAAMLHEGMLALDTATGKSRVVSSIPCPYRIAISGQHLIVAYRCGGPGGAPGRDVTEVLDWKTEKLLTRLSGPPVVGSALAVDETRRHLWVGAGDACFSPYYSNEGCPVVPGRVLHIFRLADGSLLRSVGTEVSRFNAGDILFTPGFGRGIYGGNPTLVFDAGRLHEVERLEMSLDHLRWSNGKLFATSGENLHSFQPAAKIRDPVVRGLSHFWTFDGTHHDYVSERNAIPHGDARFTPGLLGQCLRLGGGDSRARCGIRPQMVDFYYPSTVALWIKPERDGREETLIHHSTEDGRNGWRLWKMSTGEVAFCMASPATQVRCQGNQAAISKKKLLAGNWHYVVAVRDTDRLRILLDGQEEGERPLEAIQGQSGTGPELAIGGGPGDGFGFKGKIDEVAIYGRAITAGEVQAMYHAHVEFTLPSGTSPSPP